MRPGGQMGPRGRTASDPHVDSASRVGSPYAGNQPEKAEGGIQPEEAEGGDNFLLM